MDWDIILRNFSLIFIPKVRWLLIVLSNLAFIIAATVLGLPPNLADYPKGLETAQQMVKQGENADKGVALFE